MTSYHVRRAERDDAYPAFRMFRLSLYAFLRSTGVVGPEEEPDFAADWERTGALIEHTRQTAAEDWVAVDSEDRVIGWARSIERDGHLQLSHFFVDPNSQERGVGRSLLDRAFPHGRGPRRSILATPNPPALGLYLRYGVSIQGIGFSMTKKPEDVEPIGDVEFVEASVGDLPTIHRIDLEVTGFSREQDLAFLLSERPCHLLLRKGAPAGYSFGSTGKSAGPAAVLNPADLPAVARHLEVAAHGNGHEWTRFTVTNQADDTVRWALETGYRIEPFYEILLADSPFVQLDRYSLTEPGFIW